MADSGTKKMTVAEIQKARTILSDVYAKYHGDPDFRARLEADPGGVLNGEGFKVPKGRTVRLVYPADGEVNIVIPWPGDSD